MKKSVKLHCSFCNKSNHKVKLLIAARENTYICNECVAVCASMVFDKYSEVVETIMDEIKARRMIFNEIWGTDV